ncbi:MAG: 2-amino-4-hydroxy-6-hydroxymethyldihydropteridine diphosphokinase [Bacteroidetes bacterium]|jgi:2-amino-4-hydroxy-6-hydroxymethyldihydropteridine diphosphokinase|nr:2-amino-4-hydroxy-6-hydroxymethyldihydropteridine diphosphokinase [Bacteroidota bacterium]
MNHLQQAGESISRDIGMVQKISSIYETAAWGNTLQAPFLNQAIIVDTEYSADELLKKILQIESTMGRVRTERWEPRIIDIDILFYGNEIVRTDQLTIPHPEIENRRFVLEPLNEMIPEFIHPILNKTIKQLLSQCSDTLTVTPLKRHVQK